MPARRDLSFGMLLLLLELLPGYLAAVTSRLLVTASVPYSLFWLMLLSGVVGIAATSLLRAAELAVPRSYATLALGGVALAAVPALWLWGSWAAVLTAMLLVCLAYWRGVAAGGDPPAYRDMQPRFGIGIGLLLLATVLAGTSGPGLQQGVLPMLALAGVAATIAAMTALALSRADWTRIPGADQAVLLAVTLPLACLLLLSLGAVAFFSFDVPGWIVTGAMWLGHFSLPLRTVVFNIFATVFQTVLAPLFWLVNYLHTHLHAPPRTAPALIRRPTPLPIPRLHHHAATAHAGTQWLFWITVSGVVVLGLIIVAVVMLFILNRVQAFAEREPKTRRRRVKQNQETTRVESREGFWQSLRSWLRRLLSRGAVAAGRSLRSRRRLLGPAYPSDPVRRVYAQLLKRVEAQGLPRPPSTTPGEFLSQLTERWPAASAHFVALTDAYELRRYGGIELPDEQIQDLKRHLQDVRAVVRAAKPQPM